MMNYLFVLQLVSCNRCHNFSHESAALSLLQTFCWSLSMFFMFGHGPHTGAMRMTSGACSLMVSMTVRRPLDVIVNIVNRSANPSSCRCAALAEPCTSRKDLESMDSPFSATAPMCLLRNGREVFHKHVLRRLRACDLGGVFAVGIVVFVGHMGCTVVGGALSEGLTVGDHPLCLLRFFLLSFSKSQIPL